MIIKKEFYLDEDDIRAAIRDWLCYDCDNSDELLINFVIKKDTGSSDIDELQAICKEECNA